MAKGVKKLTPTTQTNRARYSTFAEAFPKNWDAPDARMDRSIARDNLGQIRVPRGRGTLTPLKTGR